jgi:Leucine-rich repeat (LRR) protein
MPEEFPIPTAVSGLVIPPCTGLVGIPEGGSPALSEIISRSLAHIQTSSKLMARHHIGEHELCGPDYGFVCAIAEDLRLPPEEVLRRMLLSDDYYTNSPTKIEDGQFINLRVTGQTLPISFIPSIEGLVVMRFEICDQDIISMLDFSISPHLTELYCFRNYQLTELDLSHIPHLKALHCCRNQLTELDLSLVTNLTYLNCSDNKITELDLSHVPHLTELICGSNQLTEIDLFPVPYLTKLYCECNQLTEIDLSHVPHLMELFCFDNNISKLDIRNILNLNNDGSALLYDRGITKLLQLPDQNFYPT